MGIDDREDKLSCFCLITATYAIEQYCKRCFLRKKYFERLEYTGDLLLTLREYPVSQVLAVFAMRNEKLGINNGEMIEPDFYSVIPDCGTDVDFPFSLQLSRAFLRYKGLTAIKAVYWAGYSMRNEKLGMSNKERKTNAVPADLASACMELAVWNMNRYRGRRIGMTGNVRGAGKDGEHFEMFMPENVKSLLEPYRRKTI